LHFAWLAWIFPGRRTDVSSAARTSLAANEFHFVLGPVSAEPFFMLAPNYSAAAQSSRIE
jgi:hypothetical protein